MPTLEDSLNKINEEALISQRTELGEVFANLDSDEIDQQTNMSTIDFNSRLSDAEINACLQMDALAREGIQITDLPRQKKRLSVSRLGMGRSEKIEAVKGQRAQQQSSSPWDKVKNMFKQSEKQ